MTILVRTSLLINPKNALRATSAMGLKRLAVRVTKQLSKICNVCVKFAQQDHQPVSRRFLQRWDATPEAG